MDRTSPIRKYRDKAKMTQEELAQRTGFSPSLISRWESGQYEPRVADARILAVTLKLAHWSLVYFDPPIFADGSVRARALNVKH